jgi:hypothetical protein
MPPQGQIIVSQLPEFLVATQVPEIAVTWYDIAALIETVAGILHEKVIDLLASCRFPDHLLAEIIRVDFAPDRHERFLWFSVHIILGHGSLPPAYSQAFLIDKGKAFIPSP